MLGLTVDHVVALLKIGSYLDMRFWIRVIGLLSPPRSATFLRGD